jgi:predicted nucleic acid-binding Zn finger protein
VVSRNPFRRVTTDLQAGAGLASEERRILESVCDELRTSRELTRAQWDRLRSALGERFDKAWRLVEQRRVKKYVFEPSGRTVWIVVGRESEYQVLPRSGYCDCSDFYFRVVDGEAGLCYHLLGQRLAEALDAYDEVREGDEFYEGLMAEWRRLSREQADE